MLRGNAAQRAKVWRDVIRRQRALHRPILSPGRTRSGVLRQLAEETRTGQGQPLPRSPIHKWREKGHGELAG